MVVIIKENSMKIILKEKVFISGLMEENIQETGKIIKWTVLVNLNGKIRENMLVNIMKIRNMVKVHSTGLKVENMMANGKMVDNQV